MATSNSTPWGARTHHTDKSAIESGRWKVVQKKTFTKWCNSYLRRSHNEITDLYEDLKDGKILNELLKIISNGMLDGKPYSFKYNKNPRMRIHRMENVGKALKFLTASGLTLTNIGAEDIVDGREKLILGVLWIIILRFEVRLYSLVCV